MPGEIATVAIGAATAAVEAASSGSAKTVEAGAQVATQIAERVSEASAKAGQSAANAAQSALQRSPDAALSAIQSAPRVASAGEAQSIPLSPTLGAQNNSEDLSPRIGNAPQPDGKTIKNAGTANDQKTSEPSQGSAESPDVELPIEDRISEASSALVREKENYSKIDPNDRESQLRQEIKIKDAEQNLRELQHQRDIRNIEQSVNGIEAKLGEALQLAEVNAKTIESQAKTIQALGEGIKTLKEYVDEKDEKKKESLAKKILDLLLYITLGEAMKLTTDAGNTAQQQAH